MSYKCENCKKKYKNNENVGITWELGKKVLCIYCYNKTIDKGDD